MGELGRREIRALLRQAQDVAREASGILLAQSSAEACVDTAAEVLKESLTLQQLQAMPLEKLRPLAMGRVAWTALANGGVRTAADAFQSSPARLEAIHGVGEQSAQEISRLAQSVYAENKAAMRLAIRPEQSDQATQGLITALVRLDAVNQSTRGTLPAAKLASAQLTDPIAEAHPASSGLRWLLTGRRRKQEARAAAETLAMLLADPVLEPLKTPGAAKALSTTAPTDPRQAFINEPARYLSLLDSRVGNVQSVHGDLDQAIVDRIEAIELDTSLLKVMLRRYQSFGARFVLAQGRVILGDDMGLGKTIQALAVMCHIAAQAKQNSKNDGAQENRAPRFLVVAPASVLINWEREVAAKSDLRVFGLHSSRDSENLAAWMRDGGVAITTFEYTANIGLCEGPLAEEIDLLVVDEAHYVKNPEAGRTQRVAALTNRAKRVMMMTGTPIENRATEFIDLITMVNPEIGSGLVHRALVVNPVEFKRKVAPAYLRRNAIDVLSELPERIEIDEWEEMTDHDEQHYLKALETGNFMAIRRAGFAAASIGQSAKMNRLLEIVDEATAAGHKVIAYSYFLDVLNAVATALGDKAYGPMTGAMAPPARQELVDEFTAAPEGSVLVSQVIAGGVGLNIQAASIVIMCEPQLKPSTENQAIARAHRMGQLKRVQVYRLLNPDSIDERIEEILSGKEIVFGEYARDSELAAAAGDALDARTVLTLIEGERDRLGVTGRAPKLEFVPGELE
jgi:superfamily II DNA or RNA helicase